jgi:hypothetical protein
MLPYWLLYLYFVVGALFERRSVVPAYSAAAPQGVPGQAPPGADLRPPVPAPGAAPDRRPGRPMLFVGALIIVLMVGLRYKVGADWDSYEYQFRLAGRFSLDSFLFKIGDPAYNFVSWQVRHAREGIWLVNLVGGLIFTWGLLRFAQTQRDPWLTMVVAVPYLVIVVAMAYSRQAMAIGILLAGLAAVHRGGSSLRFGIYAAVAALFHKTAVVMFPIVALATGRSRVINLLIALSVGLLFYDLFLASSAGIFRQRYIEGAYSSQGAGIRIVLNMIPALVYLLASRRFGFSDVEHKLWLYFSLAACLLAVALAVSPSSTAVDRIALYIIPLQLAILPRVPEAFRMHGFGKLLIIAYSAAILFVWLNFAKHAEYWIPYQMVPLWR